MRVATPFVELGPKISRRWWFSFIFAVTKSSKERPLTRRETWFLWSAFVAATAFAVSAGWSAKAERNVFNWRFGRSGSAGQSAAICRSRCCACLRWFVDMSSSVVVSDYLPNSGTPPRSRGQVVPTDWPVHLTTRQDENIEFTFKKIDSTTV